jgi:hypothetical protein
MADVVHYTLVWTLAIGKAPHERLTQSATSGLPDTRMGGASVSVDDAPHGEVHEFPHGYASRFADMVNS